MRAIGVECAKCQVAVSTPRAAHASLSGPTCVTKLRVAAAMSHAQAQTSDMTGDVRMLGIEGRMLALTCANGLSSIEGRHAGCKLRTAKFECQVLPWHARYGCERGTTKATSCEHSMYNVLSSELWLQRLTCKWVFFVFSFCLALSLPLSPSFCCSLPLCFAHPVTKLFCSRHICLRYAVCVSDLSLFVAIPALTINCNHGRPPQTFPATSFRRIAG